ncbi:hypothetical protein AB834_05030 [PVC group bacterium (ex Bugula neritina AB1)]|nr:hypothetical protein AB834_05030 [PVC group bacterium (ex Bugula neritina AB1)]
MKLEAKASPVHELINFTKGVSSVYVLIYGNVDPDALGSAWALKELLKTRDIAVKIGYTGKVGRLQNQAMINSLKIPVGPVSKEELLSAEKIAIVDAQPEFFKDYELPRFDIVIDHHPRKSDKVTDFSDIRSKCLATASILTEYLLEAKVKVDKRLATALYYGIQVDMKGLRRSATDVDRKALEYLDSRVDHNLLRRLELSQYSLNGLDYFAIALAKRRYAKNRIYTHLGSIPMADICAQIADFFISVQDIHWAIVSGVVNRTLVIVFRSDGRDKNAGELAQVAFGEIGSSGGHKTMGRAEIDAKYFTKIDLTQNEKFEKIIIESLARVDRSFIPLVKILPGDDLSFNKFSSF